MSFTRGEPITSSLGAPVAVAVDPGGKLYVSEAGRNRVVVFDARGVHRATLSGLERPISLAVDRSGRVFVGNAGRGSVEIYSPRLAPERKLGTGDGEFGQPSGIAIDGAGTAYVADSRENGSRSTAPTGRGDAPSATERTGGVSFQFPAAVAINDAAGELIVTALGDEFGSRGIYGGARVQVLTTDGAFLRSFGHYGRGEGLLVKPLGVAAVGAGRLYVTDAFQDVVQVFDQAGSYLGTVHDPEHPLRTPLGIAYDGAAGTLHVCSLTAGKVETFDLSPSVEAVTLAVSPAGEGAGTVTSAPPGISCPGACSMVVPAGTPVTLAAEAGAGSVCSGWSGACVGPGVCLLNASRDLDVVPHFDAAAPRRRAPSDFNGDGISDVLWLDKSGHQVSVWLIDRDVVPHSIPLASARRQSLGGVADATGDGKADILWRADKGAVTLWSKDGAMIAATDSVGRMENAGWVIAGLADFDGDSCADILWRHGSSGALRLWLLAVNAVAAQTEIGSARDAGWEIAALADFDGDGSADVLWRAGSDGSYWYWRLADGEAGEAVALGGHPGKRWRLQHVGDYDGDGRSDLLVRHQGDDEIMVCLTVDPVTLSSVALGPVPAAVAGE